MGRQHGSRPLLCLPRRQGSRAGQPTGYGHRRRSGGLRSRQGHPHLAPLPTIFGRVGRLTSKAPVGHKNCTAGKFADESAFGGGKLQCFPCAPGRFQPFAFNITEGEGTRHTQTWWLPNVCPVPDGKHYLRQKDVAASRWAVTAAVCAHRWPLDQAHPRRFRRHRHRATSTAPTHTPTHAPTTVHLPQRRHSQQRQRLLLPQHNHQRVTTQTPTWSPVPLPSKLPTAAPT